MGVLEKQLTPEETRNYHNLFYMLKAMNFNNWVKAYILTVIYVVGLCALASVFNRNIILVIWYDISNYIKLAAVMVVFFISSIEQSRNFQLRNMLDKYFLNDVPRDFLDGHMVIKKFKVQKDKLFIYYKRIS